MIEPTQEEIFAAFEWVIRKGLRLPSCRTCKFWQKHHEWLGQCTNQQPAMPDHPGVDYECDSCHAGNIEVSTTPDYGCVLWEERDG